MDTRTVAELGREIYLAEQNAIPFEPLSARHPDLDPSSAYAVQEEYVRLRTQRGARLVGRKIGCTSKAIQDLFGIDTPDYGHLFDDMVVPVGGTIVSSQLIAPMVEPEITFVLGQDLRGPNVTADDVLNATVSVLPSLEIIDSRVHDWRIVFADTVADNGSSSRCVFGPETKYEAGLDLVGERVRLLRDGNEFDTGSGADVLGHPAAAVAWLANAIAEYGGALRAGDYVMSGSMTRAAPVRPGETYVAEFDTLGSVSCLFS
ncbi:2-keto-4-pentenoate hydratase [Kribbella jiaozuonensis]|uniref:2-keto-4-pentenoate hydratase n=1 Tax=Kribbella jiaozuonensis TaxID=2575441 RepID=A0A4U3M3I7_9ACTN|nr:fumarylacetoacetate hydrolase family protein [Kribbella jiaozuonensis]TKK82772.1 2-keto-4-pentenoate hydratase [Kribbella jiaozuonensis]